MTRLLLDQGLPRSAAVLLRNQGWQVDHVGERDMATAADAAILDVARGESRFAPLVTVQEPDYQHAQELCCRAAPGLRAGDALHLAAALRLDATRFATLDQMLANNALKHGMALAITMTA